MTCIAWRHGIMACDSCWTYGDTQTASLIKIRRMRSGALLGQAGDNDCRAIDELLDPIKDPRKLPTRQQLADTKCNFVGLLAFPKGGVWVISTGKVDEMGFPADDDEDFGCWPAASRGNFAAVGSGADIALAAMDAHSSVSARRAVEVACRWNINCRLPVHHMQLVEPHKTVPRRTK